MSELIKSMIAPVRALIDQLHRAIDNERLELEETHGCPSKKEQDDFYLRTESLLTIVFQRNETLKLLQQLATFTNHVIEIDDPIVRELDKRLRLVQEGHADYFKVLTNRIEARKSHADLARMFNEYIIDGNRLMAIPNILASIQDPDEADTEFLKLVKEVYAMSTKYTKLVQTHPILLRRADVDNAKMDQAVKRGRGRPRKSKTESEGSEISKGMGKGKGKKKKKFKKAEEVEVEEESSSLEEEDDFSDVSDTYIDLGDGTKIAVGDVSGVKEFRQMVRLTPAKQRDLKSEAYTNMRAFLLAKLKEGRCVLGNKKLLFFHDSPIDNIPPYDLIEAFQEESTKIGKDLLGEVDSSFRFTNFIRLFFGYGTINRGVSCQTGFNVAPVQTLRKRFAEHVLQKPSWNE